MRIALLGDFALFSEKMLSENWKEYFKGVKNALSDFDVVVANLEVPITERQRTYSCKGIHIRTDKRIIDVLKYLNVSVVCLANNHICDFGKKGMLDTIKALDEANIAYYGVNGKEHLIKSGDLQICLHGFCCYSTNGVNYRNSRSASGVDTLTKQNLLECLNSDKRKGYFSILSLHWGDEYSHLPNERQVQLFHELAKDHSLIIHGHHTHLMQGIETLESSLAIYSQGNFYFDDVTSAINPNVTIKQSDATKESFIAIVELQNNTVLDWTTIGIRAGKNAMEILDNTAKIDELSRKIPFCGEEGYKTESRMMISHQLSRNRAKHDFKWLMSKMNYYSIGAYILALLYEKWYEKAY